MSTYVLRYRLTFDDIHSVTPATWRVEILVRTEGSTMMGVYDFTGSNMPLKITRGVRSNDKYEPILGSEVEIGVTLTDDLPAAASPYFTRPPEPKDFYAIDETELRVDIYKDDVLKWRGFCKPDYCQYQYTSKPYYFTIVATDRIALLKSQLVSIDAAKTGDGYISLLTLLKSGGLFNTGTSEQLKVISSMKYGTEAETFKNKSVRYELLVGDDGNAINILDSLTAIAASFGARIFYMDGSFWFQRIEDLMTETPTVYTYETDDTPTTAPLAIRKTVKGEISSAAAVYAGAINVNIGAAYKQAQIDLNYKFRGWLQNFAWTDFDGTDFDHWTNNGHATVDQHGSGTDADPYRLYFEKNPNAEGAIWQNIDGIPNGSRFSLSTTITYLKSNRMGYRLYVSKTANAANGENPNDDDLKLFAFRNGTWVVLAPAGDQGPKPGNDDNNFVTRPTKQSVGDTNNTKDLSVDTGYFNAVSDFDYDHGDTFTFLLYIINPDGTESDDTEFDGMEVSEVKLEVRADNFTGETDTIRAKSEYSETSQVDKVAFIDNTVYTANSMYESGAITDWKWSSDYFKNVTKLQSLNLYSRLNVYAKPYRIITGQFYSNTISFLNVIQQAFGDFPLFIQMYDEYDVKNCLHNMQLAEINHGVLDIGDIEKATTKQKT